jgi:TAT (twin-arginine translocation) pathway signal sequence
MNEKDKEALSSRLSFVDSRRDFLKASIAATAAALVITSQRNGAQVVSVVLLHSPHQ